MKQEINIDMKPVEPIEFYTQINDMNQLRVLKQELERHLIITNGKYISLKEEFSNLYDSLSDEEKGYEIGEEPFVHAPMEFKNVRKRFNKLEAYLGQLLSTLQFITNKIDADDGGGKCPIVDACRLGNRKKAEELFKLGEQYRRGWKVIADKNRAVGYYLEAVREGFSKAMDSLRQLAKEGHSGARFHLGEIYRNGNGVEKDVTTAIEWYKLATKQGHAEAATKLLLLAEEGSKDAVITLRKLAEKDNSLASERLKQLAELGNLEAQYHFGILLQKKKCHDDAKNWFFKAMLWGHSDAKEAYRAIIANNKTYTSNMETKQEKKDKSLNVPNFRYGLGTTHPKNGTYTKIKFDNGASGFILKPKGKPYEPMCKLTDEFKDKTFSTMWDAADALYASIQKYGNPKYQEKLFCYELIGQSFDNEDIKPLNLPVHPPYYRQMHAVGVYELKKAVYAYCCGMDEEEKPKFNEAVIIPEFLPVWQAFKKNGFDFYKFMVEKDYELIEDEEMRVEVLMGTCFPILKLPIGKFAIDWLNGYLDFFMRETDDITDTEVLRQLFFCTTEEDIWKLMATGIGDIVSLYHWYKGEYFIPLEAIGIPCFFEKDEQKASDFLDYLMSDSTGATESVRNEAMAWKRMSEDIDMLRAIVGDLERIY